MTHRLSLLALGLAAAVSAFPLAVAAQDRLMFTGMVPDGGPHSRFFEAWAQKVGEEAGGALEVDIQYGSTLANFGNVYERTTDDIVQIGWAQVGLVGGRFPLSTVTDLPFMSDGGENCSAAGWKLYESGLLDAEYEGIVPLWFGCLGQNGVHLNTQPSDLTSLAGLQVRVASQLAGKAIEAVGGTPVSMTVEEVYESLQRGTLQGAVTSWPAFNPQNLGEVTNYHMEVPLGSNMSVFFMSKSRFDALPEEAKTALMNNSGEAQSAAFGAFIDDLAQTTRDAIAGDAKHTIAAMSDADLDAWEAALEPLRAAWIAEVPGRDAVVDAFAAAHAELAGAN